ncbi:hypothetical protein [Bacillus sp. 2205SS5-2]|uniref:hypothetical protein n=1 Tax=Bacillus sp. 2205SS5-2 TaxID=3109031 RepID=UPI00300773AC
MKKLPWKTMTTTALAFSLLLTGCVPKEKNTKETSLKQKNESHANNEKNISVPVKNYNFDTAGNMFAYAEFELSGEPLAESLGLNLDILDVNAINQPTVFDYTAGVESYEYSEEAMYEVVEKSGLGLHLVNGPVIKAMAQQEQKSTEEILGERFYSLADSVGYPQEEIFQGMFPTFMEYAGGDPHYITEVNTNEYATNEDESYVPMYQVNFDSLRWDRDSMNKTLVPAAYGATFLKQALWAGDFMGGYHTINEDEELEAVTPKDDDDNNIALGVSSADGFQGVILTEEIWNKLDYISNNLFLQSATDELTGIDLAKTYQPEKGLVYLPHEIAVEESNELGSNAKAVNVTDERSILMDQMLMLWPSAEFYGMTDQRKENPNKNPAFLALFDGAPYPSAPAENIDLSKENNVNSNDPFTLTQSVLLQVFKNIDYMHFNEEHGLFIQEHDGQEQGTKMDTFQAGYTMEALRIFQRAIDGLPVGYGSGDEAEGLGTDEGKRALVMMKAQADMILDKLVMDSGLVAKGYDLKIGVEEEVNLEAQLGAIRGLTAVYLATKEEKYREAAQKIYIAMDDSLWNEVAGAYITSTGKMDYTPYTAGAVSAVYRIALQNLSNVEGDEIRSESLEQETIISRYSTFYETVIDGPSITEGMQASEFWDTGDAYKKNDESGNSDGDNVPQIQAGHGEFGISPVLLPVSIEMK